MKKKWKQTKVQYYRHKTNSKKNKNKHSILQAQKERTKKEINWKMICVEKIQNNQHQEQ